MPHTMSMDTKIASMHVLKMLTWVDASPNVWSVAYGVLIQAIGVGSIKEEVLLNSK
jgi:hypothetical protein